MNGTEANIMNEEGELDLPPRMPRPARHRHCFNALANLQRRKDLSSCTSAVVNAYATLHTDSRSSR